MMKVPVLSARIGEAPSALGGVGVLTPTTTFSIAWQRYCAQIVWHDVYSNLV